MEERSDTYVGGGTLGICESFILRPRRARRLAVVEVVGS
jgi:hypothetical protein